MTVTKCKKHATSGFFESCEHVKDLIITGNSHKVKKIRAYVYTMYVCEECIKFHNLEKYEFDFDNNPSVTTFELYTEPEEFWEHFEKEYDKMENRICWCSSCYKELIVSVNNI